MNATELPETLQEAIAYFADKTRALEFMIALRWPDGVVRCNRCECADVRFMASVMRWKCRECKNHQFSVKVGTLFEDSPLGLEKWLPAFWLITNAKNGISSCEIARALGVTQKTAWFMLQRIRLALQNESLRKQTGQVEVDETFIGGKARNMHKGKRKVNGTGPVAMTAVQGLLERTTRKRGSQVRAMVIPDRQTATVQNNVRKYVLKGAEVHTDEMGGYQGLDDTFTHQVINHAVSYVRGHVHTNGLENFWSLLKRTIRGTYVSVEPFHLFRYLDEQTFRFNERKDKDGDRGRFLTACEGIIGRRLTWKKLTAENDGLPATA
jgi:transposase-like protein